MPAVHIPILRAVRVERPDAVSPPALLPLLTPGGLTTAAAAAAGARVTAASVAVPAPTVTASAAALVADAPASLSVFRPVLVLWRNFL